MYTPGVNFQTKGTKVAPVYRLENINKSCVCKRLGVRARLDCMAIIEHTGVIMNILKLGGYRCFVNDFALVIYFS